MDKASKIFLGLLFGVLAYAMSPTSMALIYGFLVFIATFIVSG